MQTNGDAATEEDGAYHPYNDAPAAKMHAPLGATILFFRRNLSNGILKTLAQPPRALHPLQSSIFFKPRQESHRPHGVSGA